MFLKYKKRTTLQMPKIINKEKSKIIMVKSIHQILDQNEINQIKVRQIKGTQLKH
jgi:hypothetical protein